MNKNEQTPNIIQTILKFTKARKNRERASATERTSFIKLLTLTISFVSSERIAPIPKNIPTLFQLPIVVDVILENIPKDKTSLPQIILTSKKIENIMEDRTKAK